MGHTKDLWTRPDPGGETKRIPSKRHGKGKRWLACWRDPDGAERSRAFTNKRAAELHWQKQEVDVERGDYHDPKAGTELFGDIARRWLKSRKVDPKSAITYEQVYRLHIKPVLGDKPVKRPKPSDVQSLLAGVSDGNRQTAQLILTGVFELAKVDDLIRRNPATGASAAIGGARPPMRRVTVWSDVQVLKLINAHPPGLRIAPIVLAGCGVRESELYGLAVGDITDGDDPLVRVRRQIKKLGAGQWVFALPKGDKERDVPLPGWVARAITSHTVKPLALTLPWEKPDGPLVTHRLLVSCGGEHLRPKVYDGIWLPGLVKAGIIGEPTRDAHKRLRYPTNRQAGRHALRHYYASIQLAGGTGIRELAEYLGHKDPGFTLRVYGHLLPDSHDRARKAIDGRLFRPRAVSGGT